MISHVYTNILYIKHNGILKAVENIYKIKIGKNGCMLLSHVLSCAIS